MDSGISQTQSWSQAVHSLVGELRKGHKNYNIKQVKWVIQEYKVKWVQRKKWGHTFEIAKKIMWNFEI